METHSTESVLLAWSSGKDSAWALHLLRRRGVRVVGLLTTFNEKFDRVSMHGVRRTVVEAQARAAGLPLWGVNLPFPCSAAEYDTRMERAMLRAREAGVTAVAFADLHLADVRAYREERLAPLGIKALFPLWDRPQATRSLAAQMIAAGLRARVACLDPGRLPASFLAREYDESFLADLPKGVDPCGENGEFHTVCYDGPMFERPIPLESGEVVEREGFCFVDFLLAGKRGQPPFAANEQGL